jgi:tol-pal system protein YbgF
MLARLILPQAGPTLLLALLLIAPPAARAQDAGTPDGGTQERLDRIERDLSMLQRQVYRGGPIVSGDSNAAVDVQVRMDRLEQQMRDLTGRVENETNEVEQLRQRLEQVNSDMDVRMSQGQGAPPPPRPGGGSMMAAREPPSIADSVPSNPYGRRPPAAVPPPDPAENFGRLTPPGMPPPSPPGPVPERPYPGPTDLTPQVASAGSGDTLRPPGAEGLPSGSTSQQYNSAFGLLRRADYPAAEDALRSFIQQHPNDPLAGNAQYWLGESLYARGRYSEAASAFAEQYRRYPRGPKAADGLLKLGMSLARANQKHNACIALMQLDHDFPHPGSAVKDRATQEKTRLGC